MKRLAICNECTTQWMCRSTRGRVLCPSCASASVTELPPRREGRPEKYPWSEWLNRLESGEAAIVIDHETPENAQKMRGRLVRSRYMEKMRVALRGNRIFLRLIA